MFRPLIIILGGALIGIMINTLYEKIIQRNNDRLLDIIFSSFTIEYAILIGCITSINVNLIVYFSVLTIFLIISKFIKNRVNIMALIFIIIYIISIYLNNYEFANTYELSKTFSYTLMDYMIGRGAGGIASTHIIFLLLALFGLYMTNNNKTAITISSLISLIITLLIISFFQKSDIIDIIFHNNYLFIFGLVATDSVTSSYTLEGMIVFGVLIGLLTGIISIFNPIIAPFIAILVVSLFNILLDKYSYILKKH